MRRITTSVGIVALSWVVMCVSVSDAQQQLPVVLGTGSAIVGKVGIDQTTPGTTNGVQVNAALPAGTAIIGNVRIDQTTPGTTNGVQVNAALPAGSNIIGQSGIDQTTPGTTNGVAISPTSGTAAGITSVVSSTAEGSHVLKNTPGNLYSVYAVNLTSTPGYLVVVNATSAPGDGAITPLECVPLPASGAAQINYASGPPSIYSTGITAVITSASTCFTKTTGVITGFISGRVK